MVGDLLTQWAPDGMKVTGTPGRGRGFLMGSAQGFRIPSAAGEERRTTGPSTARLTPTHPPVTKGIREVGEG